MTMGVLSPPPTTVQCSVLSILDWGLMCPPSPSMGTLVELVDILQDISLKIGTDSPQVLSYDKIKA